MKTVTANEVDPITVEVIRNYYISTANQMRSILIRGSFNPVIYEMIDFSLGLYDAEAQLLAEGPALPFFCGTLSFAIRAVREYLGVENLEEGDVVMSTYGYFTGAHPQDVTLIMPIFVDGKIYGYSACKAHWGDIGAIDIYGTNTTDCWQEGLQLYGVKIKKKGVYNEELIEILRANSRVPDSIIGDMHAQIAALEYGAKKVKEVVAKYGKDTVSASIEAFLDHGEQMARKSIAEMPDGTWTAESFMDDNGVTSDPVPIKLTITKKGDELIFDTTGSAGVQVGPVNCPYATTVSVCRLVTKMITTPHYPANEGNFRPITVIAPEGDIFNAQHPAPIMMYGWPGIVLGELVFQALSTAAPERITAGSGGDLIAMMYSCTNHETGEFLVGGVDEGVGAGASYNQDGESVLIQQFFGESRNVPVEVLEERFPCHIHKYALRQDSAGPGKFRGGLGAEKLWTMLTEFNLVWIVERTQNPAFGLFGGKPGVRNVGVIFPGTSKEKRIGKVTSFKVPKGEQVHNNTGGGGGWGNPFERDVKAVLDDVIEEYVSLEAAKRDYGVAIKKVGDDYVLDEAATAKLRK